MSSIIRARNGVIVCSFVNDGTTPSRRRQYPHQGLSGDSATPYGAAVPFNPPMKAARLWAKISNGGKRYLTGRLGGVKVLILENRGRQSDNDPTHNLFFVEAPDRRQTGLDHSTTTAAAPPATARQQASEPRQPARQQPSGPE